MLQFYAGIATLSLVFLLLEIAFQNDPASNRTACYFMSFGLAGSVAVHHTNNLFFQFLCAIIGVAIAIAISRIIRKKLLGEIRITEERDAFDEANRQL